jgi:hypothetical protein
MDLQPSTGRYLVAYASADDFADKTLQMLSRLGYEILSPERFEKWRSGPTGDPARRPDCFIVDERRLRELPRSKETAGIPVIVLSRSDAPPRNDPRIRAAIKPPVGMHDLYRLVQQILEAEPRRTLRVPVDLAAVCRRSGREWNARVVSLSENGCLLESPERVPLGTTLQLAFELPGTGTLHVNAETAYELGPHHGLVFSSISPRIRQAIARYVASALLDPARGGPSR